MAINHLHKTILVAAFLVLVLDGGAAHAADVRIAAIVGEDVITTTDVNERRDLVIATAGIAATPENQQKITPRIVQSLIDESLQLQEAKNQSLTVSDEELNKAIDSLSKRGEKQETVREFIKRSQLSEASFENQLRAQLAWNKVVQRKLRRNVSIAQDEVLRAQKAAMTAPGETELRLQAIEVKIDSKNDAAAVSKLIEEIALQVKAGAEFSSIASRYINQTNVRVSPPIWVGEKTLPPPLQQALRSLTPGAVTPPLRDQGASQLIQLMERKTSLKQADNTEYALKQIAIAVPKKRDKLSMAALQKAASILRADPGSCDASSIPAVDLPTDVQFLRTHLGDMTPQQRSVVSHLEVGQVSEPLLGPDALRLVALCEKIEPAGGNLPDSETIRQQLFAEKLELEAQKHLRNLRRDAFIDIKGQ